MATHWDHARGVASGRCAPTTFAPADGARCFVLGADPAREAVALTPGDSTEVRQVVDLTDVDLVAATQDTVGQAAGTEAVPAAWPADAAEVWRFDGDAASPTLANAIVPPGEPLGFPLQHLGAVTYGREGYSGGATYCRVVPVGTTLPTGLTGPHAPPALPPGTPLPAYTLQLWINLALDAIPASAGWDIPVVQYLDASGVAAGLRIDLYGTAGPGAHSWYPWVTHYAGGAATGRLIDNVWLTAPGWVQVTLVYDRTLVGGAQLQVYLDDAYAGQALAAPGFAPAVPPADGALTVADAHGWGSWDAVRLLQRALTPAEVAASWAAARTPGTPRACQWRQEICIDGVPYASRVIAAAERRRWTDFTAPVRHLSGPHDVAFRLTLEEIP